MEEGTEEVEVVVEEVVVAVVVVEVEHPPGQPVSCLPVVVGAGAGQGEVGQLGQLSCPQRGRHRPHQPPWPRQQQTVLSS